MANALFDSYRSQALSADCDLDDSIVLVFVDHADDNPNVSTDDFLDDIAAGGRVGTSGAFASKTYTAGVFDAADVTVTSVSGDQFESIVIYNNTPGTEATKDLIAKIDTATGLPTTPNGGDITVAWDSGSNKIFKL
ncbi:MAG: hypothetical protein AB7U23_10125 [Dehalococcoidia bacterium]